VFGFTVFHTFHPDLPPGGVSDALAIINAVHDAHPASLADDLETDAALRRRFVHAHLTLAIPGREFPAGDPARQAVCDGCSLLADRRHGFYGREAPLDATARPTATWLRERFLRTLSDAPTWTPEAASRIATGLGIAGRRADMLTGFGIAVLDNLRLDAAQLDLLHRLFTLIPPELHDLRAVTARDFLGEPGLAVPLEGGGHTVNIFGLPIGAAPENSFPPDVPPGETDVFSIVAVHEANHVVDAFGVERNDALRTRRDRLIAEAGTDAGNYLRSMFPDGFFTDAPQEFFASISNQWFTDSAKTIRLGLECFDDGRPDPINQALFFADVYSRGGDTTLLYTLDPQGNLARTEAPLERSPGGLIRAITVGFHCYDFELDPEGRVTAYTRTRVPPTMDEVRLCLTAAAGLLAADPGAMEGLDADENGLLGVEDAVALLSLAVKG